jgi:hypothetical protein
MNEESQPITTGMGLLDSSEPAPQQHVENYAPPEPETQPTDPPVTDPEPAPPEPEPQPAVPPPEPPTQPAVAASAPSPSQFVYFKKTMVNMAFFVNKQPVHFEVLGQNTGVIKLDPDKDEGIIIGLQAAAGAHRGGIQQIDAELYAELKKNLPFVPSVPKSQPSIRLWKNEPRQLPKLAPVGNAATEAIRVSAPAQARPPAAAAAGDAAGGPGKQPAAFAPNLARKNGPVLRPPSTGTFRPEVPILPSK